MKDDVNCSHTTANHCCNSNSSHDKLTQKTDHLSFHISFLLWVKMNSTNWPFHNVWVFIAQLVEHSFAIKVPCKQRFLSCMAFSINVVIPVACQPTTQQTSHTNNFIKLKAMQERNLCSQVT